MFSVGGLAERLESGPGPGPDWVVILGENTDFHLAAFSLLAATARPHTRQSLTTLLSSHVTAGWLC